MDRRRTGLGIALIASGAVCACGGSAGSTGSTAASSTPAGGPPAITVAAATQTAQQWFVAINAANQALDTTTLATLEEGDAGIVDQAQYLVHRGRQKPLPAFTASSVKVIVPEHAVAGPSDFIAEASIATSSAGTTPFLAVFVHDSASSPWRVAADINMQSGASFPSFATDKDGYGLELTAQDQQALAATAQQVGLGLCNYFSKALFSTAVIDAPNLTLTSGPNTTGFVQTTSSLFTTARNSGGTATGEFRPEADNWVYRTSDGGAAGILEFGASYTVSMGGTGTLQLGQPLDGFVDPGRYVTLHSETENVVAAQIPATHGGGISVPLADTQYVNATGSAAI